MSVKISTRQVDGVTVLDMSGRITLGEGSVQLRDAVRDLLSKGQKHILLNLGDVTYIDSSGIGELVSAFTTLQQQAVTDLVLDIRYNGGGFLDIASEVAYMIAGPGPTAGQTFEVTQFSGKYPSTNPVTGQAITPVPFHSTTQGFTPSPPAGTALSCPALEVDFSAWVAPTARR